VRELCSAAHQGPTTTKDLTEYVSGLTGSPAVFTRDVVGPILVPVANRLLMDLPGAPTSGDACSSKHRQVLARTPIVLSELLSRLANYPLRDDAMILAEGFERGFTLGCASQISPRTAPNLPSIAANKLVARELIREEIAAGRVAGPFKHPPIKGLVCSPIGLVPKSTPGKFRLIHHLSWPRGSSINNGIDPHNGHVTYSSFDSIVDKIMHMGRKTALAKVDIRSAFRLLPVRPEDYHLLGFRFEGEYYYDLAMPFGCRSSCKTFERFAKFMNWCIMQDRGPADSHSIFGFNCRYGQNGDSHSSRQD